ncbi:MAG: hypothetical protein JO089_00390 [Alphaproteobacteria bacterium]|nr:hypothetical protein [Alphaproteobacteria bacterium]
MMLLSPFPAFAEESGAKAAFSHLIRCIGARNAPACRGLLTADSVELYNRFVDYGLMQCVPSGIDYVSQQRADPYVIIRAGVVTGGVRRFMRLIFAREAGNWKLDVPESLRAALGEKWRQRVALTEQLYIALRQQMGPLQNCAMVQRMVSAN